MKHTAVLAVSASLALRASASHLLVRADNSGGDVVDEGKAKVCYPASSGGVTAPCVEIGIIEAACQPNGTEPIDYAAHAQCMCNGSYFVDWRACQNCLRVHGLRSERDNVYWDRVLSVASNAFCTGTPTAQFRSVFASAQGNTKDAPPATSGDTQSSDQYPGKTEISLYYTASGTQGPGAITGAAASATKQQQTGTATGSAVVSSAVKGSKTTLTAMPTAGATTAATTRTSNGAAPTDGAGPGLAMALAGAALMVAF